MYTILQHIHWGNTQCTPSYKTYTWGDTQCTPSYNTQCTPPHKTLAVYYPTFYAGNSVYKYMYTHLQNVQWRLHWYNIQIYVHHLLIHCTMFKFVYTSIQHIYRDVYIVRTYICLHIFITYNCMVTTLHANHYYDVQTHVHHPTIYIHSVYSFIYT